MEVSDYEPDHQYHSEAQEESHKDIGRHLWTCTPSGFVYGLHYCGQYEAGLDGRLGLMQHLTGKYIQIPALRHSTNSSFPRCRSHHYSAWTRVA